MRNYDMLRNTWIYQEIEEQIRAEEGRRHREEQRQVMLEIVQARFPRIRFLVRQVAEQITDPATLRELIVKIGSAQGEKRARQVIREIRDTLKNEDDSGKDGALAADPCYNESR